MSYLLIWSTVTLLYTCNAVNTQIYVQQLMLLIWSHIAVFSSYRIGSYLGSDIPSCFLYFLCFRKLSFWQMRKQIMLFIYATSLGLTTELCTIQLTYILFLLIKRYRPKLEGTDTIIVFSLSCVSWNHRLTVLSERHWLFGCSFLKLNFLVSITWKRTLRSRGVVVRARWQSALETNSIP